MSALHRRRRRHGAVALAVAVLVLSGCSGDEGADREAGALAAAEEYVGSIASLDFEAADAMTDPEAFEHRLEDSERLDIREALPAAVEPIEDPWVQVVSPGDGNEHGVVEYAIGVSYTIDGLTGGDTIVLALEDGGDPGDVEDWTVTDALVVEDLLHAEPDRVSTGAIGDVEVPFEGGSQWVWGYPAGYDVTAADEGVEPLRVNLGVADAPPWDVSLPKLGATER